MIIWKFAQKIDDTPAMADSAALWISEVAVLAVE